MQRVARPPPNMPVSRTNGYSTSSVMSDGENDLCHFPATHFLPNMSAKTYVTGCISVKFDCVIG